MSLSPELSPGSVEPTNPADVERVLAGAPELAFVDVLARCIPTLPSKPEGTLHEQLDAIADPAYRTKVCDALRELESACAAQSNGGMQFLARTMRHFLETEPVAASMHPLMVALFLRAVAQRDGTRDTARAIAGVMDSWS